MASKTNKSKTVNIAKQNADHLRKMTEELSGFVEEHRAVISEYDRLFNRRGHFIAHLAEIAEVDTSDNTWRLDIQAGKWVQEAAAE